MRINFDIVESLAQQMVDHAVDRLPLRHPLRNFVPTAIERVTFFQPIQAHRLNRVDMWMRAGKQSARIRISMLDYQRITGNATVDDSVQYERDGSVKPSTISKMRKDRMETKPKAPEFKPRKLITRSQYEAAAMVIAQAHANKQLNLYGENAGDKYRDLLEDFKDPQQMRAQIAAELRRYEEKAAKFQEAIATQKAQLADIENDTPAKAEITISNEPGYGSPRSNPCAEIPSAERFSRFEKMVDTATIGACSCAYNGFKFHTSDCPTGSKGPCR
jgi:hypothetical protein